jgi:hypothetical protein
MAFSSEVPAMPIGRPCSICSLPFDIRKSLDEKLRLGQSTASVHRWLSEVHKVSIPLRSVYNHNTAHVKLISRAATKLSDAQRERKEQLATARAVLHDPDWDAQAYLLPAAISRDIFTTSRRLDLAAEDAFETRQHASLAQLSAQLLRSSELRGKLGGTISDASQVALQVNIGQLTSKVVEAMESDPEKRREVALTLLGRDASASPLDLGVIPDPAPSSSPSSPAPQASPVEPAQAAPAPPPKPPAPPQDGHKRPVKARTAARAKTPPTAVAEAPATVESPAPVDPPAQPFAAIDKLFGL